MSEYREVAPGIFTNPEVCGGWPTIGRTRLPAWLARDYDEQDALREFPGLTAEGYAQAKAFIEKWFREQRTPPALVRRWLEGEQIIDLSDELHPASGWAMRSTEDPMREHVRQLEAVVEAARQAEEHPHWAEARELLRSALDAVGKCADCGSEEGNCQAVTPELPESSSFSINEEAAAWVSGKGPERWSTWPPTRTDVGRLLLRAFRAGQDEKALLAMELMAELTEAHVADIADLRSRLRGLAGEWHADVGDFAALIEDTQDHHRRKLWRNLLRMAEKHSEQLMAIVEHRHQDLMGAPESEGT